MQATDNGIITQKMLIPLIPEVAPPAFDESGESGGGSGTGRPVGVEALSVALAAVKERLSVANSTGLTGLEDTGDGKSIRHKRKLIVSKTLV